MATGRWAAGLGLLLTLLALSACSYIPFIGDADATPTPEPTPRPVATAIPPTLTPTPTVVTVPVSAAPTPVPTTPPPTPQRVTVPTTTPAPPPIFIQDAPNIADTVARVRPAVVSVLAEVVGRDIFGIPQSLFNSGTGVIIDPKGLVITNYHVIQGATSITITMDDGTQVRADTVGKDRLTDLAVLQLPPGNYSFVPLSRDVSLRVGDWVIAIGNALALPGGPTVTVGVVSALGRSLDVSSDVTLYDLTQTDAVINPGNSGGPLLNLKGDLVGISTAVVRSGSSGTTVEGIGFAINMDTASLVTEQILQLGRVRWAWLGAFLDDLVPEMAARASLPIRQGAIVRQTIAEGPAARGGLQSGDIILSLDGHSVATVRELTRLLRQEFRAGQEIDVVFLRERSTMSIRLTLGERPR